MTNTYEQQETILQVENLSVVYDKKTIISDINFTERDTIRPGRQQGQIIAFLGRSGRGKSTLFRVLTGLESPTTGQVLIPDMEKIITNGEQPAKKVMEGDVGFVDQRYTLFRHKTVLQSLLFAMRKSPLGFTEKKEKVLQYLSDWGLTQCKDQYPVFLSGGQRQRTAILEQLLSSGSYMVLDEPFSGLDVGNILSVKKAFQWINASHELHTIIFSTHDIELAVELADSIYILGHPVNADGNLASSSTIIKHFDLKSMGLAWQDDFSTGHQECVKLIRETMLAS